MTNTNPIDQLIDLDTGEHGFILSSGSGRTITSRLASLGFTPGVEIIMTHNYGRGPLVVTVRGMKVALGRQEARTIRIQRNMV